MSALTSAPPETFTESIPAVPLTLEGSSVLHQIMKVRWSAWRSLISTTRENLVQDAVSAISRMEQNPSGQSAIFTQLGHKGDLIFVHFRRSFDELSEVEWTLNRLPLFDYLEPSSSYLSMVELGLYESTAKTYQALVERGIEPFTPEWNAAIEEVLERQRTAMAPRLYPEMPAHKYLCFYPMDRRRGEEKNWYTLPLKERARQTHEHGVVGRRYAGEVKQIISTSVGFDDWEWGVDLFSNDPLKFKKLIYEMRFDQVSAVYAAFGTFYVGIRCPCSQLGNFLSI